MEIIHSAENYELPEQFFLLIKPYVVGNNRQVIEDDTELLRLWQGALEAKAEHEEMSETIAEWAVSATASSPLVDDNDIRDSIRAYFGIAEFEHQQPGIWDLITSEIDEFEKIVKAEQKKNHPR